LHTSSNEKLDSCPLLELPGTFTVLLVLSPSAPMHKQTLFQLSVHPSHEIMYLPVKLGWGLLCQVTAWHHSGESPRGLP